MDITHNLLKIFKAADGASKSCSMFAKFVSDIENLPLYYPSFFKTKKTISQFEKIWCTMEEINACALSDWEDCGYESNFSIQWQCKYEKMAKKTVDDLLELFNSLMPKDIQ